MIVVIWNTSHKFHLSLYENCKYKFFDVSNKIKEKKLKIGSADKLNSTVSSNFIKFFKSENYNRGHNI